MKRIVFECLQKNNSYKKIVEFDDYDTVETIREEFIEWVMEQVGDDYDWYEEE